MLEVRRHRVGAGPRLVAVRADARAQRHRDAIDALLNQAERRRNAGSYDELDQAFAGVAASREQAAPLPAVDGERRAAIRLLDRVYLLDDEPAMSGFERVLVELALDYLEWRMPDPVRVPADVVRNAEIRAAHRTLAKGRAGWCEGVGAA
jgi:hypothetical protein